MLILLLGCAPAPESLVPTDGMHAWSDPALAGCTVTLTTTWNGNGSVDTWRDTFDADGRRASAAEDGDSDGADDAVWTHTWTGESVDTEGSSLVASVTYTDTEHREFEDGKIVRWEVDSFWQESDMATTMTGAVLTTWDGNLPTREEMHSEPEAVTLNQTTTWEWAEDLGSAVVTDGDGHTMTRTYDDQLRLVRAEVAPYADGPEYAQVTTWSYGELGPVARTFDNDEDGQDESDAEWDYDCP